MEAVKSNSEAVVDVVLSPSLQKFRFVWHTEGRSLFDLPLFRGLPGSNAAAPSSKLANVTVKIEGGHEAVVLTCCYHEVAENTTFGAYITSLYPEGVIVVDCALFAQLYMAASIYDLGLGGAAAAVDSSCFDDDANGCCCCRPRRRHRNVVGVGNNNKAVDGANPFGFFIHYGALIYEEFPHLCSLGASDPCIRKFLNQHARGSLASAARGQWVAPLQTSSSPSSLATDDVDDRQQLWVGFTRELGIVVETMAAWRERLQASIVKWAEHTLQQTTPVEDGTVITTTVYNDTQQTGNSSGRRRYNAVAVARLVKIKAARGALLLKVLGGNGAAATR